MQIDYYYSLMSPWAYFGAPRLYELQKKHGFIINHYPLDILKLFTLSGGHPTCKKSRSTQNLQNDGAKKMAKKIKVTN